MRIKIEYCSGGYFRATDPRGNREHESGENWTRAIASRFLDTFERLYGYDRRSIRFDVR